MSDVDDSGRRSLGVLAFAGAVLLVVLAIVVWRLPGSARPVGFAATSQSIARDTVAVVTLQIDSIEASTGKVSARVSVSPGPAVPAGGVDVLVGSESHEVVTVTRDERAAQEPAVFDVDRGSVTNYPFDRYRVSVSVAALPAKSSKVPGTDGTETLPVQVVGNSSAFGFSVQGASVSQPDPSQVDLRLAVERTTTHRIWALGMMAIDWALALAAATVVLSIVLRARKWDARYLAWLGSMIFALAAFRNAAPGGPPVGVFMDTAAFFWAEAVVVLCLVTLVVLHLSRPRHEVE